MLRGFCSRSDRAARSSNQPVCDKQPGDETDRDYSSDEDIDSWFVLHHVPDGLTIATLATGVLGGLTGTPATAPVAVAAALHAD